MFNSICDVRTLLAAIGRLRDGKALNAQPSDARLCVPFHLLWGRWAEQERKA